MPRTLKQLNTDLLAILAELEQHRDNAKDLGYQAKPHYLDQSIHHGYASADSLLMAVGQESQDAKALAQVVKMAGEAA